MNRHIGAAALAAVIAAPGAASLVGPAEAGANVVCKQMTSGHSRRPVHGMAQLVAINKWRTLAGPAWNRWAHAKNRSTTCHKAGNWWHCVAKARPCRKLGVKQ